MRDAQRLGNVPAHHGPADELGGLGTAATNGREIDRWTGARHSEQTMPTEERPALGGVAREPLPERRVDGGELGSGPRNGRDGDPQFPMELIEVEDIETSHHRAIQQDGVEPFEPASSPDEPRDLLRCVATVDPHAAHAHRFDAVGGRDGDGGDRGPSVRPPKRAVVHTDHPNVQLRESRTQR